MSVLEQPAITAPAATTARRLSGSLLFLLAGLAALGALSTNIILPAFPSIATSLGVAPRDLGLTLSSFFIAFALGQLFVGPLSDRFGRQWLVLGGLGVFFVGSAICALADTMTTLIIGRVIQALGVCAASVLSRAIARDLFDGEALARALSLTMVAMAAAPGFSPLLGSALDAQFGWRAAFILVGAMGVVIAVVYFAGVGETHPPDRRSASSPRAVAAAYGGLLRDRRFILPALAVSLVIGGLYAFFAAAPAVLMVSLGLSAMQLGLFFAATVFVVFAAGLMAPRLAHRFGASAVATAGLVLAIAGGVLVLALAQQMTFPLFALAITVFLMGLGLVNPLGTAIALHPFGRQAGLASALLGFLQMSLAAIGTAVAISLPLAPITALGVVLSSGAVAALLIFLARSSPRGSLKA